MKSIAHVSKSTVSALSLIVAISVLLLWLSYMMAAKLYSESRLIPHGVLLVSCFLLLASLATGCYVLLEKPGGLFDKKPGNAAMAMPDESACMAEEEKHQEIYIRSVEANLVVTEEYRQRLKESIHDYIYWSMAPLLEESEMAVLWVEYKEWLDRPLYVPTGRNWKWKQNVDVRHIDVRHLTWNIAKRMGMENGYNTVVCAKFIKALFPDLCKNVQWTTLSQCLNADPEKGHVKIDIPDDKDPGVFHYPMSMPALQVKE